MPEGASSSLSNREPFSDSVALKALSQFVIRQLVRKSCWEDAFYAVERITRRQRERRIVDRFVAEQDNHEVRFCYGQIAQYVTKSWL